MQFTTEDLHWASQWDAVDSYRPHLQSAWHNLHLEVTLLLLHRSSSPQVSSSWSHSSHTGCSWWHCRMCMHHVVLLAALGCSWLLAHSTQTQGVIGHWCSLQTSSSHLQSQRCSCCNSPLRSLSISGATQDDFSLQELKTWPSWIWYVQEISKNFTRGVYFEKTVAFKLFCIKINLFCHTFFFKHPVAAKILYFTKKLG